ncbi:MAG: ferredoxin-type protein NapF [Gammaproteobacteria bacterium]|nr:ferredoxin-type protein NapF [Gammaproteobacteria bacterium]
MKTQGLNRKQFLQGQFKGELALRPPWSKEEATFIDTCTRCFKCAESCTSNLIVKGSGGFPEMSFLRQGCDYCEACVQSCPESALSLTHENHFYPWSQKAFINQQCFAAQGITCRSCGEVCETDAIEIEIKLGGVSELRINAAACNGCGECLHVCPAHAIEIQKKNILSQSEKCTDDVYPVSKIPCGENL